MIPIKKIIKLLSLSNCELIYFCTEPNQSSAILLSIEKIKEWFDMKKLNVQKVNTHHYIYEEGITWEFIVSRKTFNHIKTTKEKKTNSRMAK